MGGWGGEGGGKGYIHKFCSGKFKQLFTVWKHQSLLLQLIGYKYFYCMESLQLQVSIFCRETQNCKLHHNSNLILSVLNHYFAWTKTLHFNKYYSNYLSQSFCGTALVHITSFVTK